MLAVCLGCSTAIAQSLLPVGSPAVYQPVVFSAQKKDETSKLASQGSTAPWLLQSDIRTAPMTIEQGRVSPPFGILTAGTLAQATPAVPTASTQDGATSMPSSMTSPLLPNVPSSLNQDKLKIPAQTGTPIVGQPAIPGGTLPLAQEKQVSGDNVNSQNQNQPPKTLSQEQKAASDLEKAAQAGPALRKSFSALFTQQRPFLLYSQDASITYLMPNALVDHAPLSRYLRNILEQRALTQWQAQRELASNASMLADAPSGQNSGAQEVPLEERPSLVITGRVQDRFYSSDFSSLYLEEIKSLDGEKQPIQVFSFNYDNMANAPFSLQNLFKATDARGLAGTIELIDAYIQTDIVRQKSIRLGTTVRPDQDAWLQELKPSLSLLENFSLVPSRDTGKIAGLSFHFNPGILGSVADGQYDVYVPAAIFSAALSDRFAPHFGGEALKVSRHNAKGFSAASVNIEGLRAGAELGGDMLIEGEVPGNWCDGFHLTLTDKNSGQIVTEGVVKLLPDLPNYGLASNMMRFRAEISISGDGGRPGALLFEPYEVTVSDDHVVLRSESACNPKKPMAMPDPDKDQIEIDVNY